jgi:general secretion pathway protein G
VRRKSPERKGFTLIELLVVLVILGLLASLVGPALFKKVGTSRQKTAVAQMALIETALKTFKLDVGRYPTTEEGLQGMQVRPEGLSSWDGPYLEKDVPLDPWGKPYLYVRPGEKHEFDLKTLGADGKIGGEGEDKDILNWGDK